MLLTTQPGETMSLFAADPPPSPALAAFTAGRRRDAASAPSRPAEETAHERRERLRDERRALVSALSRLTGEPHKVIHARVNRDTGARVGHRRRRRRSSRRATRCSSARRARRR